MLALGMARRLKKTTGKTYPIIIGDADLGGLPSRKEQLVVTWENLWNYVFEPADVQATYTRKKKEVYAHAMNVALSLGMDENTEKYDGKVIFLNALAGAPEAAVEHKLAMLHAICEHSEIIDFKNKGHFGIFGDADLEETWDEIVKKLSKNLM